MPTVLLMRWVCSLGIACTSALPSADEWSKPEPSIGMETVAGRAAHTASALRDGRVLIAGGCVTDGCSEATTETLFVASDGTGAARGPDLSSPRDSHTATVLTDERVLFVGGYAGEGEGVLASVEVFDPAADTVEEIGELSTPRGGHAAALLPDGRVLIVGGWIGPRTYTASAELVDPETETGTVSDAADLPFAADALDAISLADGRVLVTGGQVEPGIATSSAAIYNPVEDEWSTAESMRSPRLKHFSVLLEDGQVLVLGGTPDDQNLLATTELFDPDTGTFSPGPDMHEPRYKLTGGAVVADAERVVIAGGDKP